MSGILTTESQTFEEALDDLKQNGYSFMFIKKNEFLYCSEKEMNFRSYELIITEKYRYENKNEPYKNTVLYAVESPEYGLKGFLVN